MNASSQFLRQHAGAYCKAILNALAENDFLSGLLECVNLL